MTLSDELKTLLQSKGADLVGFADLREIASDVRENLPFGISIAVALNPEIIAGIQDGPNQPYYEEYRRANQLLGTLGSQAAQFLKQRGHNTSSFAATNVGIDLQTLSTRLPHKTIATRAGIGWIGKCALLVTQEFGSAVRLTTVLTDAYLPTGEPVNTSQCGDCTACVDICPGHAISGINWQVGIPRESLYDAFACQRKARELSAEKIGIGESICGICIAACPWTQKYLKKSR